MPNDEIVVDEMKSELQVADDPFFEKPTFAVRRHFSPRYLRLSRECVKQRHFSLYHHLAGTPAIKNSDERKFSRSRNGVCLPREDYRPRERSETRFPRMP